MTIKYLKRIFYFADKFECKRFIYLICDMSYHTNTQVEFPNYGFDFEVLGVLNLDTDCSNPILCSILFLVGFWWAFLGRILRYLSWRSTKYFFSDLKAVTHFPLNLKFICMNLIASPWFCALFLKLDIPTVFRKQNR